MIKTYDTGFHVKSVISNVLENSSYDEVNFSKKYHFLNGISRGVTTCLVLYNCDSHKVEKNITKKPKDRGAVYPILLVMRPMNGHIISCTTGFEANNIPILIPSLYVSGSLII